MGLLVGFVMAEVGPRLLDGLGLTASAHGQSSSSGGDWILGVVVMVVVLSLGELVYDLPLDWWVDLVHDRRWGLSTQTPRGFAADQAKSFLLGLVLTPLLLIPLYGVIRSTELWWLWGWLLVVAFSVLAGFLFPVLIAPVFNRFEPLHDAALAARLGRVADRAGVELAGVQVADESRRSTRDNAYVSGLGSTRRVILYDTLLEHPPEVVEQVVAHELGHWRLHHLRRQIPVLAAAALALFLGLRALAGWDWLFEQAGVDGIGDPAGLPILLLAVQVGFAVVGLVTSYVSRAFERQADLFALDLLRSPASMAEMHRRLHVKNLTDLDPGRLQRLRATHPPAAERLELTRRWSRAPDPEPRRQLLDSA